ncbi:hypothetical protein OHB26_21515 [Nocardia sp. NBC_01503]|uniref:hypothetical protein n=1 Tax=Nocardia sp. NBC_01503 TaxID=2975997 RepID=UPI002E7ABE77|nr:hypothetical protein [Nocardia sp. NBC_01503]WTL29565.1 hypothetical protein OHB26_21515 [Nocardia sp. NBC_01503]
MPIPQTTSATGGATEQAVAPGVAASDAPDLTTSVAPSLAVSPAPGLAAGADAPSRPTPATRTAPIAETASAARASAHDADDHRGDHRRSAEKLALDITESLLPAAPPQWRQLRLAFSVTVAAVTADAVFVISDDETVTVEVPSTAVELVQALRLVTVGPEDRAWWQVVIGRDRSGVTECEFGYGDLPFPPNRLLPAAAYRADLAEFPRERLPVWLAARLAVDDGRQRLPELLTRARIDRRGPATPVTFLEPGTALARWATVAAAAVAIRTEWGPRILGSTAVFEATNGSGSTLQLLPGGRAVLSGGVWNAAELDAAYHAGGPLPEFYAGVPDWLDIPALNPRAATGELSFCYWWDGDGWWSGESPAPTEIGAAVPGLWTPATVVDIVCGVLGDSASRPAVTDLVAATESGWVTPDLVESAFTTDEDTDIPGAWTQLAVAGLTR